MDWVWSAIHLTDGTHVHGLDLRIPKMPRMYMGYIQGGNSEYRELSHDDCAESFEDKGLPKTTRWTIEPDGLVVDMHMMGHGPLRLVADDGRVDMFPRAWGTVSTKDGREGVCWAEWNRNFLG